MYSSISVPHDLCVFGTWEYFEAVNIFQLYKFAGPWTWAFNINVKGFST